jgi:hypothetical protein
MRPMRSGVERSMQKQVEDVLSVVDHRTQSLQMDLTEKIESTQVKLDNWLLDWRRITFEVRKLTQTQ